MSSAPVESSQRNLSFDSLDLDDMITKARVYAKDNCRHGDEDAIFRSIINIIQHDQFQDDPKSYLDKWKKRFEIIGSPLPEHPFNFLNTYFKS